MEKQFAACPPDSHLHHHFILFGGGIEMRFRVDSWSHTRHSCGLGE
jgi:hypothetical protein